MPTRNKEELMRLYGRDRFQSVISRPENPRSDAHRMRMFVHPASLAGKTMALYDRLTGHSGQREGVAEMEDLHRQRQDRRTNQQPAEAQTESQWTPEGSRATGNQQAAIRESMQRQAGLIRDAGGTVTPELMERTIPEAYARVGTAPTFSERAQQELGEQPVEQRAQQELGEQPVEQQRPEGTEGLRPDDQVRLRDGQVLLGDGSVRDASSFSQQDREARERAEMQRRMGMAQGFAGAGRHAPQESAGDIASRREDAQRMKDINRLPEDRRADALEQYQMEQKARRESRLTHFDRFEGSIGSPDHKARERRMEAYKTRLKELTDAGALEKKEAKKMEQQERVIANEEAKVDAQAKQAERVAAFEEERNKIMRESSERTERIEQLKAEQAKREHQEKMSVAEERLLVLKESGTASQLKSATTEIEQLREGYLALNTGVEDKKDRTEIMASQAMLQIDHHEDFNDFLSFGETDQRVVRRSAANIMGATKKNARDAMIEAIRAHKARLESTRRR